MPVKAHVSDCSGMTGVVVKYYTAVQLCCSGDVPMVRALVVRVYKLKRRSITSESITAPFPAQIETESNTCLARIPASTTVELPRSTAMALES